MKDQKPPVVQTSVQTADVDLNNLFGGAGADNVITPASTGAKPSIFSRPGAADLSFLNEPEEVAAKPAPVKKEAKPVATTKKAAPVKDAAPVVEDEAPENEDDDNVEEAETTDVAEVLGELDAAEVEGAEGEEGTAAKKAGRPKTEKSALTDFFKKQIEAKEIVPFDDYDETKQTIDEYLAGMSQKDLDELWTVNQQQKSTQVKSDVTQEIFESLPEELQIAMRYATDGGTDMKGLFSALSQVESTRELDIAKPADQEEIARQFLQATNFGDTDEIEAEITSWKELNVLDKKANQFKPKLDKMSEQIVARKLAEQEVINTKKQKAAQAYVDNTFNALKDSQINGIKLDKKTQGFLYHSLVNAQYPSMSGKPTNLLGHLLEKHQFVEPNYALVAEALWLLSDPENYRAQVKQLGANKEVESTVRTLKTEDGRRQGSSATPKELKTPGDAGKKVNKIARPTSIFQR